MFTRYFISSNIYHGNVNKPLLLGNVDPAQYGVLAEHVGQRHTLEEMNQIVAELLTRQPYLEGQSHIDVTVMFETPNGCNPLHNLRFLNPNWQQQERSSAGVKYLQ